MVEPDGVVGIEDPATVAERAPEPVVAEGEPDVGDARVVHAVGIGPGDTDYIHGRAERLLRDADVVVGFETVVDLVADRVGGETLTCGYDDESSTLSTFADRVDDGDRGVAALMGDPNHSGYQFVGKVQAAVDAPVRVVPGISSLQLAASRARTPMEHTTFVTLHRSGDLSDAMTRLRRDVGDRHLLVLPRPYDVMPEDVAAELLDAGARRDLEALVLERLSFPDETTTRTTLGALAAGAGGETAEDTAFSDLSVLCVRRNQ